MKMEQTKCSVTSAYKIKTPWNCPEESIQHPEHDESLKSRNREVFPKYKFPNVNLSVTEHGTDHQNMDVLG